MIRYIAGLDWSGDPGDPSKNPEGNPLLVVCSCHVKVEDHFLLDDTLKRLRSQLRVSENYIFKHMRSAQSTRNMFMNAMIGCPVVIHVGIVDRRAWSLDYLKLTNSTERLLTALSEHFAQCNDAIVCGQRLLVDTNRAEKKFISSLTLALRKSNRRMDRGSFKNVVARPDHRTDAALVQVADMFAGHFNRSDRSGEMNLSPKIIVRHLN